MKRFIVPMLVLLMVFAFTPIETAPDDGVVKVSQVDTAVSAVILPSESITLPAIMTSSKVIGQEAAVATYANALIGNSTGSATTTGQFADIVQAAMPPPSDLAPRLRRTKYLTGSVLNSMSFTGMEIRDHQAIHC